MEQFAWYWACKTNSFESIHSTRTCNLTKVNYGIRCALQKTYRTITIHDHNAELLIVWEVLRKSVYTNSTT